MTEEIVLELTPEQTEVQTLKEENEKFKEQAKLSENDAELEELRTENNNLKKARLDKAHSSLSAKEKYFVTERFKDNKDVSIERQLDLVETIIKIRKDIYSVEKNATKIIETKINKEDSNKAMEEWDKMFQIN